MPNKLASIILVCENLARDCADWQLILGYPPKLMDDYAVFAAGNVNVSLYARDSLGRHFPDVDLSQNPRALWGLSFYNDTSPEQALQSCPQTRNLPIFLNDKPHIEATYDAACVNEIDHVVVQTQDADAIADLFGERLGIRLALRQNVPEWGGEMLFFRTNHMSIEVIANAKSAPEDSLWGLALRCQDINQVHARLVAAGVRVSDIRDGRKKGTRVATVKDHVMGIGTLLIEHEAH